MLKPESKSILFADCELTGFDTWSNSIIEVSFIQKTGDYIERKTFHARPESVEKWSEDAEKVHGIALWDAMRNPTHTQMADDILDFIKPCEKFIYHGLRKFDYIRLESLFFKVGKVFEFRKKCPIETVDSTIRLAKERLQLPNYKLNTLCDYYGIKLDHHKSESDVNATFELWKRLKED